MKKKLLIVALFSLMLCLTACSKEVVLPENFDADTYSNTVAQITAYVLSMDSESLTIMANDAEYYYTEEDLGYDIAVFESLCSGALTAEKEAGTPISFTGDVIYNVSGINQDIVTITIPVQYENYTVNYEFTFEPNSRAEYNPYVYEYELTQAVVSTQRSMAELMKEAGMNTIMGIGVVFVVLIFIAFVIGLFKYLPGSGAKAQKKEAETKKAPVVAPVATTVATTPATTSAVSDNLMDDKELVAVITAAVMAANGSGPAITSSDKLIVRSIKRVSR